MALSGPEVSIAGVGMSELTRYYRRSAGLLARDALVAAAEDADLSVKAIDGMVLNLSPLAGADVQAEFGLSLQGALGLGDLKLLSRVDSQGATVGQMLGLAATWIEQHDVKAVACVFADTPITMTRRSARAFSANSQSLSGVPGLDEVYGIFGGPGTYALLASRFMAETGASEADLANVAITNRTWATLNDLAFYRSPLSTEDYFKSRYVVTPLRLVDCALPVNGAAAVILMSPDRARGETRKPLHVLGRGEMHRQLHWRAGEEFSGHSAAASAGAQAFGRAGVRPGDMDIIEMYDPFSFVPLVLLEQYGFCGPGEARQLYAEGACGPGGRMPVNTGGGQTASFYLQGFTPLLEAAAQLRGEAGERQVTGAQLGAVTFCGGAMEHHACAILASEV